MDDKNEGVQLVQHTLRVGESYFVCVSDLIFLNGEPFVVLEWGGPAENQHPAVKLKLDPSRLTAPKNKGAMFVYADPLVDPRPVH